MRSDDSLLPTPQAPTAAPSPKALPVRRIPCCVRRVQRPVHDVEAHLRAAAVWAALLQRPDPAVQDPREAAEAE